MFISLVQTSSLTPINNNNNNPFHHSSSSSSLTPKSLFLGNALKSLLFYTQQRPLLLGYKRPRKLTTQASLIDTPVLFWAGRICIFYALLKSGLAGSHSNPIFSDVDSGDGVGGEPGDMGFSKWMNSIKGKPVKEAADRRKLVSKWQPTTKGTLKRNYRVPSKSEGKRLLKAIASLLAEDDHFVDASSHKGCRIRRESAHGESVCCNNVRALFDELPTPHLTVEITPFPAGPLTENDYTKAEKLERVLRTGPSV